MLAENPAARGLIVAILQLETNNIHVTRYGISFPTFCKRHVLLMYIALTHRLHYDVIMLNVIMMQIYVGIHWYTLPKASENW